MGATGGGGATGAGAAGSGAAGAGATGAGGGAAGSGAGAVGAGAGAGGAAGAGATGAGGGAAGSGAGAAGASAGAGGAGAGAGIGACCEGAIMFWPGLDRTPAVGRIPIATATSRATAPITKIAATALATRTNGLRPRRLGAAPTRVCVPVYSPVTRSRSSAIAV
jgi:hypothetical protein